MHPQLSDKRIGAAHGLCDILSCSDLAIKVCREFIQALDACHVSIWARLTGGCNQEKDSLNKCLRKEVSCLFLVRPS